MLDWEIGNFLKVVLLVQLVSYVTTVLDLPVARQVICFIYLSFVPGIVLLRILRMHRMDLIKTILFSVGLSIAFSMFCGLLVNELYPVFGISQPLQFIFPTLSGVTLVLCAFASVRDRDFRNHVMRETVFNKYALLLFCLPLMSILGALLLSTLGNSSISLLLIVLISGLVILGTVSKKASSSSYALALLAIAIALLFLFTFTSRYIIGYDVYGEYYVFKLTATNLHWSNTIPSANLELATYNSMLSITILPTIYSYVLNVDSAWVLKLVYPLFFSLVPLALYLIYEKQVGKRIAFLSTFFFLSYNVFYDEMLGLARQMIAEFFFILLILLLVEKEMDKRKRFILFTVFSAALVVSHYSISYIFLFLILIDALYLSLTRNVAAKRERNFIWTSFFLFLVMVFSWYTFTSGSAPLRALLITDQSVLNSTLTDFLNLATRSSSVTTAIGIGQTISLMHAIGTRIFQLVQFFIIVGFARVILKRREVKFDREYYAMAFTGMIFLLMCIVLPFLASSLMMSRIYHITLIFLAPFFALGGETLFGWIPKLKRVTLPLICILLVIFFLFQSGFVYEVTGDIPSWGALSKNRINPVTNMALYVEYTHEQDVFSAKWLSQNVVGLPKVYADRLSNYHTLTSYAMLSPAYQHDWAYLLTNSTKNVEDGAFIYLGSLNVVYGLAENAGGENLWNISEISAVLNKSNLLYSNGASSIYGKAG